MNRCPQHLVSFDSRYLFGVYLFWLGFVSSVFVLTSRELFWCCSVWWYTLVHQMFVAADLPVKMCDWQDRINLSNVRQVCKDKNKSTATKLSPVFPSATCAAKEAEVKANRRCHVTRTISTVQITLRLKLFFVYFFCTCKHRSLYKQKTS